MSERHYGLKKGNKVKIWFPTHYEICKVVGFSPTDNNRCVLKDKQGKEFMWTCEHCEKMEDK